MQPSRKAAARIIALMRKGRNEPAKAYMKPIASGPGMLEMLATELAIPSMLPCSLRAILFDRNDGIDVLINPKPAANKEFPRKKINTFWKLGIIIVPIAISIGPKAISFSSPMLLESVFIKKP